MWGQKFPNLTGGIAEMLPNHHLTKPVLIGEIRADGQFDIISQTEPVPGDAWTDFLPESAVLESDWSDLQCGMYNTRDQDLRAADLELLIHAATRAVRTTLSPGGEGRVRGRPLAFHQHPDSQCA